MNGKPRIRPDRDAAGKRHFESYYAHDVPQRVLLERERYLKHEKTLEERMFGDPPIWRSALAQNGKQKNG